MNDLSPQEREQTLVRLVQAHETTLLRLCCAMLGDEQLARDAVQETFFKAFRRLRSFRGESSEKTWLTRIAINTCRDMRRQAWFRMEDRSVSLESLPEPAGPCTQAQSDLAMDVMRLPDRLKEVVLLRCYQGMTTDEIARALGVPRRTVSYRLKRAREALRLEWGEEARHE